jgi:hypothetical protein
MDAKQGMQSTQLIRPDVTIPNHSDDHDVLFSSRLEDFPKAVTEAGWDDRVVDLDGADEDRFRVRE